MAGASASASAVAVAAAAAFSIGHSHRQFPLSVPLAQLSPPHSFDPCRNGARAALIPTCLSVASPSCAPAASPPGKWRAALLLLPASLYSACPVSVCRASFLDSGAGRFRGLAGGLNGKFVQDLRRAAAGRNPTKGGMGVRSMAGQSGESLEEAIQSKNSQCAVVLYSKTWCPYCSMVKGLFTKLGVPFELVELDQLLDEQDVQDALRRLTGQSTVPSVFIGGKHIGGCDDTMDLHRRGKLVPALEATGLKITAA